MMIDTALVFLAFLVYIAVIAYTLWLGARLVGAVERIARVMEERRPGHDAG
jgi:uncharacterized membrane protein (DUF485 family)